MYELYNAISSIKSYIRYNIALVYERIPVSKARLKWRDVVSRAEFAHEATVLTWRGKDVAAIVPMSSVDLRAIGPEKKMPTAAKRPKKATSKSA